MVVDDYDREPRYPAPGGRRKQGSKRALRRRDNAAMSVVRLVCNARRMHREWRRLVSLVCCEPYKSQVRDILMHRVTARIRKRWRLDIANARAGSSA